MNGRIYDPNLGRFLQADPFIQFPKNSQSYNRYSYVLNSPLSYTDPSGYFLSGLKKIGRNIIRGATKIFGAELVNLVGSAVATYFGGPWGAAAWQYEFSRAMGASSSGALRGAFTAYVSASLGGMGTGNPAGDFIVQGTVGGIMSDLNGGNFGHAFWAAGLNSVVGGGSATSNPYANVVISGVIGGTISKATGGKFANGAYSAAFSAALAQSWDTRTEDEIWADGVAAENAAMLDAGGDLLANNVLEQWLPDPLYDNLASPNAKQCISTCVSNYYGESYEYAEFLAEQGLPGFGAKQFFEYSEEKLRTQGTRNLYTDDKFNDGRRMIRTLKQAKVAAGALAVAGAGAKGYVWGARGYCAVECWGENGG